MRNHTMACDYPEGCSCGASEWNKLVADLARHKAALTGAMDALQRLTGSHDKWAEAVSLTALQQIDTLLKP